MPRFNPKLINDPNQVADELFDGLIAAYAGRCEKIGTRSLVRADIPAGKVALLVGGGAGHEPIYHGLVGTNMADGAACGDIFAAPSPTIAYEATAAAHRGNGVLYLYGNYAGDVLNFDLAAEQAQKNGIEVQTVLIADDVASAPPDQKQNRRGIAGLIPIVKMVGAASQTADNVTTLAHIARKACLQTRSVGAAMAPGSIPATGKPTFELDDGMIGLGMGIHGEAGVKTIPMTSADELTPMMLDLIFSDFSDDPEVADLESGDEIVFFINSLGATTMMECLICMKRAKQYLEEKGVQLFDVIVGPFVTCQEMAGISFSITRVDAELKGLWSAPCQSLGFSKMSGPGHSAHEASAVRSSPTAASQQPTSAASNVATKSRVRSTEGLSVLQTRAMLESVGHAIIEAEPLLTDADRALGDGDHGVGMQRGFQAALKALPKPNAPGTTVGSLFHGLGDQLLTTMGGASGVVFGSFFLSAGECLDRASCFGTHELSDWLQEAVSSIMNRGGAKPGNKTMLDALAPAAKAAKENVNASLKDAFAAVAQAAEAGKEATRDMVATMGRAKTFGQNSLGHIDPGAISVSLILSTMSRCVPQT